MTLQHGSDAVNPERYDSPGGQCAETQVADFLWGVVRLMQPDHVLEFGPYWGHTSVRLAQALVANGRGLLTTVEVDGKFATATRDRLRDAGVSEFARVLHGDFRSVDVAPPDGGLYAVAFFDSWWERDVEYMTARPYLADGALLVFHDCALYHRDGAVRERVAGLQRQGFIRGFFVPTPYGVVVAQHNPHPL